MATGLKSWYGTVGLTVPDEPPTRKKAPPTPSLCGGAAPTVRPDAEEIKIIDVSLAQRPGCHPSAGSVPGVIGMGAPALIYGQQEQYMSTYQATMCEQRPTPKKPREGKMVFDESTVLGCGQPVRVNVPARLAEQMQGLEATKGTNMVRDARVGMHMATLAMRGGKW